MNADGFRARRRHDIDMAVVADRQIQLADLVRLGQIGVEIVFAVKFIVARNLAVRRQTRRDGKLDDLFVNQRFKYDRSARYNYNKTRVVE